MAKVNTAEEHIAMAEEHLANANTVMTALTSRIQSGEYPSVSDLESGGSLLLLYVNLASQHRKMSTFYVDNSEFEVDESEEVDD